MEKMPFIGQMHTIIKIVEKVETRNSTGEMDVTDIVIAIPVSFREDISGSEDVEGKIRNMIKRSYIIRYSDEIKAKGDDLVVIDGNKRFDIYYIQELGRRRFLKLMVRDYE
jgi:hypothetical protein